MGFGGLREQHDVGAVPAAPECDRQADPAACAGDDEGAVGSCRGVVGHLSLGHFRQAVLAFSFLQVRYPVMATMDNEAQTSSGIPLDVV